jgi:Putative Ig domain
VGSEAEDPIVKLLSLRVRNRWVAVLVTLAVAVAVAVAVVGLTAASAPVAQAAEAPLTTSAHVTGHPFLGVLSSSYSPSVFATEDAAGVDNITVGASWASAEPSQGVFSANYLTSLQQKIAAVQAAGMKVVLDPGFQYTPTWVFALPGGTQFVNQFGDVFGQGMAQSSGDAIPNAITDMSVRSAEGVYLTWLGQQITPGEIVAVREGGGPLGELRYPGPDVTATGHINSFWAYDTSSQADLPSDIVGWVPGTGTTAQAQQFMDIYNQNIVAYGVWLNGALEAAFHVKEFVLLPGWGERPGGEATEVGNLLKQPLGQGKDEFNEGLDWTDLLPQLPDPTNSIAYTTYLDAPSQGSTTALEDPADYIASLVAGTSIRQGGENTGNGTISTLTLCMERANALNFYVVEWMGEAQLISATNGTDPGTPTFNQLGESVSDPTLIPPPVVSTTSLPGGQIGLGYSATLTASSGDPPYVWTQISGLLPPGLSLSFSTGVISGTPTSAGTWTFGVQVVDSVGNSGTATLAITVPGTGTTTTSANPTGTTSSSPTASTGPQQTLTGASVGIAATPDGGGYWIASATGGVEQFGDATFYGSMAGHTLNAPINHIVATPDGHGYWLVAADGGTFSFGDAGFFGSMGGRTLNAPVVDIAPTSDGKGYWLVASDGGIFAFGDATFHGSMGGQRLNRPVVGIATDSATGGYWEVATDGGIFAFGAPFHGSTGALSLNKPVNGMAVTGDGNGYWFVASDGGIFAFGDAAFEGSVGNVHLNAPIVGMAADVASGGYWLVASDGGVFTGGAPFLGSA